MMSTCVCGAFVFALRKKKQKTTNTRERLTFEEWEL